ERRPLRRDGDDRHRPRRRRSSRTRRDRVRVRSRQQRALGGGVRDGGAPRARGRARALVGGRGARRRRRRARRDARRRAAAALGMEVLCCDPPRAEREGDAGFLPLARVLDAADAVTLHTPLAVAGRHATHHLIGARELARLRPGAVVLNTSRGPVADGAALLAALESGRLAAAVLDVWEGEPAPDLALVRRTSLATPHIAGYSLDGKVAGTRAIARALADFLGVPPPVGAALPRAGRVSIADTGRAALRSAVRSAYAIRDDDRRLRSAVVLEPRERAAAFDALRRDYPVRREFAAYEVETPGLADRDRARLARFGFALG